MKVICLWSGGKDSVYACHLALNMGLKVEKLVTFYPQDPESKLFHVPGIKWTTLQAESIGISQDMVKTPKNQEYDILRRTLAQLREQHGIEGVVTGVIASNYQRRILREVCDDAELELITPLWGQDPFEIIRQIIDSNFKAIIIGVYAEGLTQQWLGRGVDRHFLGHLKKLSKTWGINPCGEGGEYETFVVDAPRFSKRIKLVDCRVFWHRNWGELMISDAILVEKS